MFLFKTSKKTNAFDLYNDLYNYQITDRNMKYS